MFIIHHLLPRTLWKSRLKSVCGIFMQHWLESYRVWAFKISTASHFLWTNIWLVRLISLVCHLSYSWYFLKYSTYLTWTKVPIYLWLQLIKSGLGTLEVLQRHAFSLTFPCWDLNHMFCLDSWLITPRAMGVCAWKMLNSFQLAVCLETLTWPLHFVQRV